MHGALSICQILQLSRQKSQELELFFGSRDLLRDRRSALGTQQRSVLRQPCSARVLQGQVRHISQVELRAPKPKKLLQRHLFGHLQQGGVRRLVGPWLIVLGGFQRLPLGHLCRTFIDNGVFELFDGALLLITLLREKDIVQGARLELLRVFEAENVVIGRGDHVFCRLEKQVLPHCLQLLESFPSGVDVEPDRPNLHQNLLLLFLPIFVLDLEPG
mmetsp:Transcript_62749/g.130454  ORF Transcript_62749/g.130454 Transcript_62749/m.130454 type:complete len:216 (-) Transcript_62749:1422-2069(-)